MCKHEFIKINDVKACTKCGLTVTYDGKMMIDRDFVRQFRKNMRKKK